MITPPLASAPSPTPSKKIHINWGKSGPNQDRMEKAIHHWFTNGEYKFDSDGEMIVDPAFLHEGWISRQICCIDTSILMNQSKLTLAMVYEERNSYLLMMMSSLLV